MTRPSSADASPKTSSGQSKNSLAGNVRPKFGSEKRGFRAERLKRRFTLTAYIIDSWLSNEVQSQKESSACPDSQPRLLAPLLPPPARNRRHLLSGRAPALRE